jgi:hypothetical protein
MIASKLHVFALAIGVAAIASPALAKTWHPGYEARAQAPGAVGPDGMTAHRADALRECNAEANKLLQTDWGVRQTEVLNSCLAEHGEME